MDREFLIKLFGMAKNENENGWSLSCDQKVMKLMEEVGGLSTSILVLDGKKVMKGVMRMLYMKLLM